MKPQGEKNNPSRADAPMRMVFIAKDAAWQKYRNDVLRKLARTYNCKIDVLTSREIAPYLGSDSHLTYVPLWSPFSSRTKLNFFPGAIWHIVKVRPEAVFGLNNISNLTEYLLLLLCKVLGVRFVWWTHGFDHQYVNHGKLSRLRTGIMAFFLPKADAIITFSEAGRQHLLSGAIAKEKVFHAPNTLDTDQLEAIFQKNAQYSRSDLCRKLGLPAERKYLIFCGRLTPKKNVKEAIDVAASVHGQLSDVHFLIIGDGPDRSRLESYCQERQFDFVHFCGEIYDEEQLAQWFRAASLFLMPRYAGLSIVHAMSQGLPFATTPDDEHGPEFQYVENQKNGIIEPPEKIAGKIIDLLRNPDKLQLMSQEARMTVKNRAGIQGMIEQMFKALSPSGQRPGRVQEGH